MHKTTCEYGMEPGTRFSIHMTTGTLLLCIYWNHLNSDCHNYWEGRARSVTEKIITASNERMNFRLVVSFGDDRESSSLALTN